MVSCVWESLTRSESKVRRPVSRISWWTGPKPPVVFRDLNHSDTSWPACFLSNWSFRLSVEANSGIG